jgi:hypothetical protein
VPRESDIARNLQVQEEADRLEKDRVKKLTLEINERQEEEDLNEALAAVSCDICFIGGQWWFAESKLQLMWECGYRYPCFILLPLSAVKQMGFFYSLWGGGEKGRKRPREGYS